MTKEEFQKFVESGHPVYLDGATGSNLLKRGMPAGVCPEEWILGHKEVLLALQKEFAEAGSHVIYALQRSGRWKVPGGRRPDHDRRTACPYGHHGF